MKIIQNIKFYQDSKEEKIPSFSPAFPYIASQAQLDNYRDTFVPWHWHKAIELFYVESGSLTYYTPNNIITFNAGTGGLVNSNILHMTKPQTNFEKNIQLLHIFDPVLIAGYLGSDIEEKYINPIITNPHLEIIPLFPNNQKEKLILKKIRQAFTIDERETGYEIKIRNYLSDIWLEMYKLVSSNLDQKSITINKKNEKIKTMMIFIHEHFDEKISVEDIAESAFLSERECYRVFKNCLHTTPLEYIKSYRLQIACQLLKDSEISITEIAHNCGIGSSSYFGSIFRQYIGCSPMQYRKKWQNNNKT